jgi:hypothetical protein
MKLISIEGQMYKVSNKIYEEISEANISGDYDKQDDLMIQVQENYKNIGFVNNFYFH